MTLLKYLVVVLNIIFLGSTLDAMEKEQTLYVHIEASKETYDSKSNDNYFNQSDSSTTIISSAFDTSNWGERSNNAPQETIDTEYQTHRDFALDAQREAIAEDHTTQQRDKYDTSSPNIKETQTNEISQTNNSFYKPNVNYIKEIKDNLKSPEYRDNLLKIRASLEEKWNKCTFGNAELKKQIKFIDALLDGTINRMLVQIKKGDLKTAKKTFNELKKAWPWQANINSIITGYSLEESTFIECIGTDIMQFAKNSLILRKDFLDEHWGALSQVQSFYGKIRDIQLRGDIKSLISEREQLIEDFQNKRYADFKLTIEAKLVVLDTALSNPITNIFFTIKNAKFNKASKALDDFKQQLSDHFEEHNITNKAEAKADMIKREGIDLLVMANKCFKSRPDYQEQQKIILKNEQNITQIDSLDMVSTTINQDTITITPEANQRITETLDTLNDQSLEAVSSHINTLITILKEQKLDAQVNGKYFAVGLESCALLRRYIENPNRRIVAQPDANVLIFKGRTAALEFVSHNPVACREQSFTLTPEAFALLQARGLDPEQFIYCIGNEVQHQLYSEFVMLLNAIAEIESNESIQPLLDMVLTYTQIGQKYTEQNNIEKAFDSADLSWAWLDCAKAIYIKGIDLTEKTTIDIAKGIMHGLQNAVLNNVNMVLHPVETMSNVANTFCHLAYCFGKFMEPIMIYDGETEIDAETITRVNEEWKENLQSVINATKGITVEGSAAFITEFIISPKITKAGIGLLSHYAQTPVAQLLKVAKEAKDKIGDKTQKLIGVARQKIADKLGNNVAVTANGVKVPVSNTPQVLQRSMDKGKDGDVSKKSKSKTSNIKENKYTRPDAIKVTAKQAIAEAEKLGFEKTNYYYKGQPIFKKGNRYISPDADIHNGGVWKMADSVKNLEHKSTRMGTYDKDLNRIRD